MSQGIAPNGQTVIPINYSYRSEEALSHCKSTPIINFCCSSKTLVTVDCFIFLHNRHFVVCFSVPGSVHYCPSRQHTDSVPFRSQNTLAMILTADCFFSVFEACAKWDAATRVTCFVSDIKQNAQVLSSVIESNKLSFQSAGRSDSLLFAVF